MTLKAHGLPFLLLLKLAMERNLSFIHSLLQMVNHIIYLQARVGE